MKCNQCFMDAKELGHVDEPSLIEQCGTRKGCSRGRFACCLLADRRYNRSKHSHRGIANLLETKRQAIANIAAAGMRVTLPVTVIRGINNDGVGSIVAFAANNNDKIFGVFFQPIMFQAGTSR